MQFCADLSQKFKSVEAIYTDASEGFRTKPPNPLPGQFPSRTITTRSIIPGQFPSRTITPPENCHLENSPGQFSSKSIVLHLDN